MTDSVETRIAAFVARYTPAIAADIVACRGRLRALFPRGYELVFDNYNALVFGISPSPKSKEAFLSIAAYPRWINLFFLHGAGLHDPEGLLQGQGVQVRGVRLAAPGDLDRAAVRQLIAQAVAPLAQALDAAPPLAPLAQALDAAPPLATVICMEAARQRPRRPA